MSSSTTTHTRNSTESPTSRIPGFYRLCPADRLQALAQARVIGDTEIALYQNERLGVQTANVLAENVISTFDLPCGVGVNFLINQVDRVIPMVVEEPSVIAAVTNMARLARRSGGFITHSDASIMIGQVQLMNVSDPDTCIKKLESALPDLRAMARAVHPRLQERGGGLRGIEIRRVTYDEPGHPVEQMVVLHLLLDCADAMGANMVNTLAERLTPHIELVTGEQVGLRILSNLADKRLAHAKVTLRAADLATEHMSGPEVARRIAAAWRFAWADPYRAATHNKGVMNGIDAVALATGNDWRAIEAGAHAHCVIDGQYRPMTRWELDEQGDLVGTIAIPSQFGTIGGATSLHPIVRANLTMLNLKGARDLGEIAAAVGLAQNLGALRALVTEGIQAGHMRMHARIVATTAGATDDELEAICEQLVRCREFSIPRAQHFLSELRGEQR